MKTQTDDTVDWEPSLFYIIANLDDFDNPDYEDLSGEEPGSVYLIAMREWVTHV